MSIFKGHFSSAVQENHQFFCDEKLALNTFTNNNGATEPNETVKLLKVLVLTSFTRSSCGVIFNDSIKYLKNAGLTDTFDRLQPNQTIINNNKSGGTFISAKYTRFNPATKKYEQNQEMISNWTEIDQLITYHENRQFDSAFPENENLEQQLKDINTSLEQCLIIECKVLNQTTKVHFKLNFFNRNSRSNSREIAAPTSSVWTGVPSTAYDIPYSYSNSTNFQSSSTSNLGSITLANPNDKFSQNAVAAPLRMYFDPNSNTYEAGTAQMLARLLTDIAPAPIESLPEVVLNGGVPESPQDTIERTAPFTTGEAIPLTIQNGNPHTLGPDYIECGDKKLVKLKVINRSKEAYDKDSVVIISRINNEWIIVKSFGTSSAEPVFTIGEWTFSKLIANSDHYFKSASHKLSGNSPLTNRAVYINKARSVFFKNMKNAINSTKMTTIYSSELIDEIVSRNTPKIVDVDFTPSTEFAISSIFDWLPQDLFGFSANENLKVLYNNNVNNIPATDLNDVTSPDSRSLFWGPLFTNGYGKISCYNNVAEDAQFTTQQGSKLFSNNSNIVSTNTSTTTTPNPSQCQELTNKLGQYFVEGFYPDSPEFINSILTQIPAELCHKLFDNIKYLNNSWANMGSVNFDMDIATKSIKPPFYGSPLGGNQLQISPLSLEVGGIAYKSYDFLKEQMLANQNILISQVESSILNIAKDMSSNQNITLQQIKSPLTEEKKRILDVFRGVRQANTNPSIANRTAAIRLDGAGFADLPEHKGSNVVGIVSARTTITTNTNRVKFIIDEHFGTHVFGGTSSFGRTFATWGSSSNSIYSFGTLYLNAQIYDSWPENQTIFDPRYFKVLHFNEGKVATPPTSGIPIGGNMKVDFTIPTNPSGQPIAINTQITNNTKLSDTPIKNTIRRGQLLSDDGFWYPKHSIGLLKVGEPIIIEPEENVHPFANLVTSNSGRNFKVNDEIECSKNIIVVVKKINSNGGIVDFDFKQIDSDTESYLASGEDIRPQDFNIDLNPSTTTSAPGTPPPELFFRLSIPNTNPNGAPAVFFFRKGIVKIQWLKDLPPKEHKGSGVNISRLTSQSNSGKGSDPPGNGLVRGTIETTVPIEKNTSNKYDVFLHFHNDIGLYSITGNNSPNTSKDTVQYIKINIT